MVFDGNGFIAGVQNVVPEELALEEFYPFSTSPWYKKADFFGKPVIICFEIIIFTQLVNPHVYFKAYFSTAYFVDPAIICTGGRTQAEFDLEGTGNRIALQHGPGALDAMIIPLEESGMDNEVILNKLHFQ